MGNLGECAKGNHDFIPIGHESMDIAPWEPGKPTPSGRSWFSPIHVADIRWYVVRACANCTEVWWQEYDPAVARKRAANG